MKLPRQWAEPAILIRTSTLEAANVLKNLMERCVGVLWYGNLYNRKQCDYEICILHFDKTLVTWMGFFPSQQYVTDAPFVQSSATARGQFNLAAKCSGGPLILSRMLASVSLRFTSSSTRSSRSSYASNVVVNISAKRQKARYHGRLHLQRTPQSLRQLQYRHWWLAIFLSFLGLYVVFQTNLKNRAALSAGFSRTQWWARHWGMPWIFLEFYSLSSYYL